MNAGARIRMCSLGVCSAAILAASHRDLPAAQAARATEIIAVEAQPLAANARRVMEALEFLGAPLPDSIAIRLTNAIRAQDARALQSALDPQAAFVARVEPDGRVTTSRGAASLVLQQEGYTPILIKVINPDGRTAPLFITSPQTGPIYAGVAELSMRRQNQTRLRENENTSGVADRFLDMEMFTAAPMKRELSGLAVEYAIALVYSAAAGTRDVTIGFRAGQDASRAAEDRTARATAEIRPALSVKLAVRDSNGAPTLGRFLFTDRLGHVYPPQPKRLAPDFFFQKHIYRGDGETVRLPPGQFTMFYGRGPEYRWLKKTVSVPQQGPATLEVRLERWIDPMAYGFYSGDHHIHAAGCAHYTSPTQGVLARDMFRQVKGEGLNVGCVLTWGPCFDFQQQFFSGGVDPWSEPLTVLKYDIEVSGFGSQALGHVCLINLKEQIYPGATGSKGWPTWTTPVLRWAKSQGAITGYAHSGSGLQVNPPAAAKRLLARHDRDADSELSSDEAGAGLLPEAFERIDTNRDQRLSETELTASIDRVADQLPNLAIPELNSVGAQEIFVTTALGLCDFISAMDTARLLEWNCWYHLLNCGFPLKVSGETDFPCMSSTRVGQGRVYVQLGNVDRVDFAAWARGIAEGRSYVSDGYAHAVEFTVEGRRAGDTLELAEPRAVRVRAKVAFSSETPIEVAYGTAMPAGGPRLIGDTVTFHDTVSAADSELAPPRTRVVEVVVNGRSVASTQVAPDDRVHEFEFFIPIERSSWVALRQFPQLHTNPVNVLVAGQPIRASRQSARWCIGSIEQLWRVRSRAIAEPERAEAQKTFWQAIDLYRRIAEESPDL